MRPIDHFCASLERLDISYSGRAESFSKDNMSRLAEEFVSLTSAALPGKSGREAAEDLFYRAMERAAPEQSGGVFAARLGALARFFQEDFDDLTALEEEDWDDIKETLEEAAGEMNMDILGSLMGELLSLGKLH